MHETTLYPNIHLKGTGIYLKRLTRQKGYKVRDLQRLLHLSCPQPIYRWFKGQVLPSVDHLYTLFGCYVCIWKACSFPKGKACRSK